MVATVALATERFLAFDLRLLLFSWILYARNGLDVNNVLRELAGNANIFGCKWSGL